MTALGEPMNAGRRRAEPTRPGERISAPALSLPKGGGAVRGLGESFESQDFTGTASFSIPVPVPAARGLAPELRLAYSSGAGNGTFGMGFGLSLPSIARKTSDGIPRYDGTDTFVLSDEGELTPALTWNAARKEWVPDRRLEPDAAPAWEVVAYRPRHEGPFARIERWIRLASGESHWRLLTRADELHVFGRTGTARIFDPEQPRRIFQWLLEEVRDAHGNEIRYHYSADDESRAGHDLRANRYVSEIEYGNYFADGEERFAFQVVFDHGARPDAFSSYRSGFEIRTARRCEQIRIYHRFDDRLGGAPFLTRTLRFEYEQAPAPGLSLLKQVEETGFRREDDGTLLRQPMPPLVLTHAGFSPAGQRYQQLVVEGHGSLPGTLTEGRYLPVDLQGEGLPGILYSDGVTTLYWEPEGGGRYSGPRAPERFPVDRDLRDSGLTITSLEGNGEPDLLVRAPGRTGYYRSARAGAWEPFQPFTSAPTALLDPRTEMVDMDGSGRADLLVLRDDQVFSYPSLGRHGYGPPDVAEIETGFPAAAPAGPDEVLTFADVFGDGLSHRVRIRSGSVECWPNLGHGRFGPKVILEDAPLFEGAFDARRLFLADVDGSGAADLVYVGFDRVRVWFNRSGNGFSEPLTLPLPAPCDDLSQVSFADVYGNGTSCLVLTRLVPQVTHHVYDFAGDGKPYLLTAIDNGMGASTRIRYTTSVKQYLADKRAGRPWATRLFFPVHVVDEVEHRDEISGARYVTRHKYHDGYYDPQEREFRGFGFVETWNGEDFESFVAAREIADFPLEPIDEALWVPPAYTRTWYHTGAFLEAGAIARQEARELWHGDPEAPPLPGSVFAAEIFDQDAATLRQAHEALAGQMRRREVYGLDGSAAAADPYSVSESTVKVRLVQPRKQQRYAVLFAYVEESLLYDYERRPADPRVRHELSLAVDAFGNVTRSCSVAYPRRKNEDVTVYPEQDKPHAVVTEETFVNHEDTEQEPFRWIGVSCERREHELAGLTLPPRGCFAFEDLERQVREALGHPLAYGQPFTAGELQARLFSWSRAYFWNEAQTEALPLAQISSRGLLHHEETAVLTSSLVEEAFGDRVAPGQLVEAGYWPDQGYWWARGLIQHYFEEPDRFFLPCRVDGAFAGVDPASHLNPTTTVAYDFYQLLPTAVTSSVRDALTLTVAAEIDYQVLSPWRLTDANGNVSEVLFDPLGKVIVSTVYGTEEGRPAGDAPLADYILVPGAALQDVLDHPATYLQDATAFFFYDLFAWARSRQPPSAVSLHRQKHVHELAPGEECRIETGIAYSDGLGRLVESKLLAGVEPSLAEPRWIVSGRTVYNNKGEAVAQYLPWFSATPAYEDQRQVTEQGRVPPPTVFHYDPLDRLIRTDTPKGFFSKVELSAWQTKSYDEDDTVLDSAYYKEFMKDYPEHPTLQQKNEKDALDKAAAFYDTPSVEILDGLGRTIRSLANNLGAVAPAAFDKIVEGTGITLEEIWNRLVAFLRQRPAARFHQGRISPQELWNRLVADGYLEEGRRDPAVAWVTEKLRPYDPSFQQAFRAQYGELAAPILELLKENGLTTLHVLDVEGREIRSVDPRLFYSDVTQGTEWANFVYLYDMAGNALRTASADAGTRWSLADVFGNPVRSWDSRGFEITRRYDRLERPTEVRVQGGDGEPLDNLTEALIYGEGQPDARANNLNGRLYQHFDPAGLLTRASYSLGCQVMTTTRKVRPDYRQEADWTPEAREQVAQEEGFTTRFLYDALDRVLKDVTPDGSVTTHHYNRAGQLTKVQAALRGPTGEVLEETIVEEIEYDASGQRTLIRYGNGVESRYVYEETTLRLAEIHTTRSQEMLQAIACTYL